MIAVFLHVFYPKSLKFLLGRLKQAPFPFNLYVNLVQDFSDHLVDRIRREFPAAHINISANQGMDPGGQLRTLHYWISKGQNEEFLIFLHSKKDPELRDLFSSIVLPEKARLAFKKFEDPQVGMVGVKEWHLYPGKKWGDPIHSCDFYCDWLKLNNYKTNSFGFIGGTMFWVRSSIYKNVFAGFPILDLVKELEPYSTAGKIHALERIFGYIVLSQGYRIEGI